MSISLPTWTRREIPLLGRRHRIWAIVAMGLRHELRRPAAIVVVTLGIVFVVVPSLVLVLFASFLLQGQALDLTFFFNPASSITVLFFTTLIASVIGAGLISDDLETMALTLYLSRPLTAADYLTAKAAILATLTALITIVPLVLTPLLGAILGLFGSDVAAEALGIGLVLGALFTAFFTSLSLFLSSLTRRRAYAASALFAIVFGLYGTAQVLASPGTVNNPALLYLSPWDDYLAIARAAFGVSGGPIDWAPALAIILVITVLTAVATWMRMRALEVVSG